MTVTIADFDYLDHRIIALESDVEILIKRLDETIERINKLEQNIG